MEEELDDEYSSPTKDVTVEELISSVMKNKSLLSGRLNRNLRFISANDASECTPRFRSGGKNLLEGPRLLESRSAMQKIEEYSHQNVPLSASKMTRSVSTPEITRTKPFAVKKAGLSVFHSNTLENNKQLVNENAVSALGGRPDVAKSLLASLRKPSTNVTRLPQVNDVTSNEDIKFKSSSLVNIHKSYLDGMNSVNSNLQSHRFKNVSDNSTLSKEIVNKERTDNSNSVQSIRSVEEMLREFTVNNKEKFYECSAPSTSKVTTKTEKASFDIPFAASPKQSIHLSNSDIITVNGQSYFKLQQFGKGGSSVVYEVLDLISRHRRAIKIVDLENEDESVKESYKNEVQILQKLQKHSRIIKVFDHEETQTQLKLVMEAGGIDLAAIINDARRKKTVIPPFSIQHYFRDMLLAVQQIHSEGIIHSDLKPANFLLVDGKIKLIDFGIASSIQHDMTSVLKDNQSGTFNYMSPESLSDIHSGPIINGKWQDKPTIKIGVKSDIWSLGCILYNLVYGYTPFQHLNSPIQKLAAISSPNSKISFASLSDNYLFDVLQKSLQFNPRVRPSIDELLKHPYLNHDLALMLQKDENKILQ